MASLYRKPVWVKNKATGQKTKTRSRKWWGQYKDANGQLCREPLAIDKQAAQAMLNQLVKRVERQAAMTPEEAKLRVLQELQGKR